MSNILIVGANRGIGYYMAIRLLEKGNNVTVLDIQDDHISELKKRYQNSLLIIEFLKQQIRSQYHKKWHQKQICTKLE